MTGVRWNYATAILVVAFAILLAWAKPAKAAMRIAGDTGGRIGAYIEKYQGWRYAGDIVIIDGLCASACTIVLGAIRHDNICVTERATLGFHSAWDLGPDGREVPNEKATQFLYALYPAPVQRWIAARGGLTPRMIFLRGKALQAMYKPCYLNTNASAHPR